MNWLTDSIIQYLKNHPTVKTVYVTLNSKGDYKKTIGEIEEIQLRVVDELLRPRILADLENELKDNLPLLAKKA